MRQDELENAVTATPRSTVLLTKDSRARPENIRSAEHS
jgi:hypothetical protein